MEDRRPAWQAEENFGPCLAASARSAVVKIDDRFADESTAGAFDLRPAGAETVTS